MGRVVSPTPTPLSSGRVVPALVVSYDMHGRAVGLFYPQPTGQVQVGWGRGTGKLAGVGWDERKVESAKSNRPPNVVSRTEEACVSRCLIQKTSLKYAPIFEQSVE